MSILIKGATMPKSCKGCDLYKHCDVPFSEEYFKRDSGRPSDCPLVEIPPHGDLIDRDELMDVMRHKFHDKAPSSTDVLLQLVFVPTVIESEVE